MIARSEPSGDKLQLQLGSICSGSVLLPLLTSNLYVSAVFPFAVASSTLNKTKVERVDFLDTAVTHQERGVVGSEPDPAGEDVASLREVAQAQDRFRCAISDSYPHKFSGPAQVCAHVDILAIARPFVVAEMSRFRQDRPMIRASIEQHQFCGVGAKSSDKNPIGRHSG